MVTALYRRYRPETFSEMVGQRHVTDPLMAALRNGKIGHAYLFSGPRGCGKTTSARILARCLNCAEGPTDSPCGVCESCIELGRDGGGSIDVVEIDAASHGSVEDARDLRERATFAPARDRYKIFIIDEAHMVTTHGFNALLKIVEEPPEHLKFVFATTEPEKVLGTIRSRTHHYPFRLIPPATLIDYTQSLCDEENITIDTGVLPLLVRAGGGSARDTLSILDQLIAGSDDGVVRLDRATALLGYTSSELIDEVVDAIATGDAAAVFQSVDRVVQTGQDPRRFAEDLLQRLRDLIIVGASDVDGAASVLRGVPEDQLQRMFAQSQGFARGELSKIADMVSQSLNHMVGATAPRMQLELMIARVMARVRTVHESQANAQTVRQHSRESEAQAPRRQPAAQEAQPQQAKPQQTESSAAEHSQQQSPNAAETLQQARAFLREDDSSQHAAPAPGGANPDQLRQSLQSEMDRISTAPPSTEFLNGGENAPAQSPSTQQAEPSQVERSQAERASAQRQPDAQHTTPAQAPVPQQTASQQSAHSEPQPSDVSEQGRADTTTPGNAPAEEPDNARADAPANESDPTIEDLHEIWPDLLDELLQENRAAFNAVQAVSPLDLAGDVLKVGISNTSDLEAFKQNGADPLREALFDSLGVKLRYLPVKIDRQPARESSSREPSSGATSTDDADADDPHRAARFDDNESETAARPREAEAPLAQESAPDPAEPAPAPRISAESAQPSGPGDTPDSKSIADSEPSPALGEETARDQHAAKQSEPESEAEPESEPEPVDPVLARVAQITKNTSTQQSPQSSGDNGAVNDSAQEQHERSSEQFRRPTAAERAAALGLAGGNGASPTNGAARTSRVSFSSDSPPDSKRSTMGGSAQSGQPGQAETVATALTHSEKAEPAGFVRYGEAVVREVFGATLVEERPLPDEEK
jgi:DNA polymerase-3 subunit gamma/tau